MNSKLESLFRQYHNAAVAEFARGERRVTKDGEAFKRGLKNWREGFCRLATVDGGRALDAGETLAFAESLTHYQTKFYAKKYPDLQGKSLVPQCPEKIPEGADYLATLAFDFTGKPQIISTGAHRTDFPKISGMVSKDTTPIVGSAIVADLSISDIRAAAMPGLGSADLPSQMLLAGKRIVNISDDDLVIRGNSNLGIQGLLSVTGAVAGNFNVGDWLNVARTADEICDDIIRAYTAHGKATSWAWRADRFALPPDLYLKVMTMPRFVSNTTVTIKQWIEAMFSDPETGFQFKIVQNNKGAPWTGTTNGRCAIYRKSDECIAYVSPIAEEILPTAWDGYSYNNVIHSRCGGVYALVPASVRYYDNG